MIQMYDGLVNSIETVTTGAINATDTTINVLNETQIPDAPNLLVLGSGASAETVKLTAKTGNVLTVVRGLQGTAKSWASGTLVARNFTEYDHRAFKENISELETKQGNISSLTTLYVSTSGNDSNNGLAVGTPLRNIQTAINKIPQIVNHEVNINVATGDYTENILFNGFIGKGNIALKGGTAISNYYVINSCSQYNVDCTLNVIGINAKTTTDVGFIIQKCIFSSFSFCRVPMSSAFDGFLVAQGSRATISDCNTENRKIGIQCNNATVVSINNTGGGNGTGLQASAGTIMKIGTQPTGTVNEGTYGGGVIR